MTSIVASEAPLKPTGTTLMPAASRNRSPFMWVELPMPAWLKKSGFAWASRDQLLHRSRRRAKVGPTSAVVENPSRVTPAKSFNES